MRPEHLLIQFPHVPNEGFTLYHWPTQRIVAYATTLETIKAAKRLLCS